MRGHILVIKLNDEQQARLAAGELVYPEDVEDREYELRCVDPSSCNGWTECPELVHRCEHGCNAADGPDENDPDGGECPGFKKKLPDLAIIGYPAEYTYNCWAGEEDFEFHGVMHTYQHGHGWVVPYPGCVVDAIAEMPPDDAHLYPIGEHEIEDEWDDTWCYLNFAHDPGEEPNTAGEPTYGDRRL